MIFLGMNRYMRILQLAGISLLACIPFGAAVAQEPAANEDEAPRRYAVEVIIFRYAQDVGTGSERFLPDPPPVIEEGFEDAPTPLVSTPAFEPEPVIENEELPQSEHDIGFVMLAEDQLTMTQTFDLLDRLDVYEPLMHFGWSQLTWPDENTEPMDIARFGRPPVALEGTLELYLSRYLHLVVDLQLDAPESTVIGDGSMENGDSGDFLGYMDEQQTGKVRYRIEENRILKNGDTRYFDHPKFGVLARVTRIEEPADAAETELLGYPAE